MTQSISRIFAALAIALCALALAPQPAALAQGEQAAAQDDAPRVPERFESPRATMRTFLESMGEGRIADATECFDLPATLRAEAGGTARRLYAVLNRIELIDLDRIPDHQEAQRGDLRSYAYFPQRGNPDHARILAAHRDGEITLTRVQSGAWRFSRATLDGVDAFHNAVAHLERRAGVAEVEMDWSTRLRSMMPASLRGSFLGVDYWQWLGLLLLIFVGVILDFVVQGALRTAAATRIRAKGGEVKPEALKRAMRPYGLLAAALFLMLSVRLLGLPLEAMRILVPALRLILTVAGVWAAFRTTDLVAEVFAQRAAKTATKFDDLLVPLVRKTLKHVYALLIDDREGRVITSFSSQTPAIREALQPRKDESRRVATAKLVGESVARYALEQGINAVVFDRAGYPYQGIIKEVAESARSAGLKL